jgi:uncharacterized membrane protein YhaH (DUF805 family)
MLGGAMLTAGYFAILAIGPMGGIVFAALPALIMIGLATCLRRLHDRGKNIWWMVLLIGGPFVSLGLAEQLVAQGSPGAELASLPLSLGGIGLEIWAWIEIGFMRGQLRVNQYGVEPSASGGIFQSDVSSV